MVNKEELTVNKITVYMSQKINLGSYETRDFHVGVEINHNEGADIHNEINAAKDLCAKEVGDYYKRIKSEMLGTKKDGGKVSDETMKLLQLIDNSKTVEELDELKESVKGITSPDDKLVVFKAYNEAKINLSKK